MSAAGGQHVNCSLGGSRGILRNFANNSVDVPIGSDDVLESSLDLEAPSAAKRMEVGAGVKLEQRVHMDPSDLTFWQDEPAGLIYLNYCSRVELERIIAGGRRAQKAEGFLEEVVVGN